MEGVGARLGRSSTRYGPATVFTGPVRKWKKKWVHVSPSSASSNSNNNNNNNNHSHNSTSNGNNGSHLLLYKWTPLTQSQNTTTNNNNGDTNSAKEAAAQPPEEPPRRKFKYIPVAVLEEQRNEAAENEGAEKVEDESKPIDAADPSAADATRNNETSDEKPDINDVPMEESQSPDKNQVVRQDLNESTLDLSLGLTSHEDEHDSDSNFNQMRDGQ